MKLNLTLHAFQYSASQSGGMHYGAHPLIFKRAEELRNNMTPAEKVLWNYLKMNEWGCKFRRQHPLFMYVADFYCHQLKLVIEIDGNIHDLEEVKSNDAIRENNLQELGLKIIRFKNEDVLQHLENVLTQIKHVVNNTK